jgi:hypothetical protein
MHEPGSWHVTPDSGGEGKVPKFRDPKEILDESLAGLPPQVEPHPPVIQRAEVWPYPELDKLWVRVETSAFVAFPNLSFTALDPDGQVVATMFVVEARQPYQSLTMHLRSTPRPGEHYRLEIELSRDDAVLDTRTLDFDLVYQDPAEARRKAQESQDG